MLPDFIGIGAAKSGTTWLFRCLQEHPEVFAHTKCYRWIKVVFQLDNKAWPDLSGSSASREKAEEISANLGYILTLPQNYIPPTRWEAFEPYTTRAMTARLVEVFEKGLTRSPLEKRGRQ